MTPEVMNSVIDSLANKLAVPTSRLLEVLPRLGYKELWILIVEFSAFCLCVALTVLFIHLSIKFDDVDKTLERWANIMFILSIILLIMSFFDASGVVFWVHDPEAWALDYVIKILR